MPVFSRDGAAAEETTLSVIRASAAKQSIEECARRVVEVWEQMPKNASYILPADLNKAIRRLQRAIQRDERGSPIAPNAAKL